MQMHSKNKYMLVEHYMSFYHDMMSLMSHVYDVCIWSYYRLCSFKITISFEVLGWNDM